jgi:hypothetical protein
MNFIIDDSTSTNSLIIPDICITSSQRGGDVIHVNGYEYLFYQNGIDNHDFMNINVLLTQNIKFRCRHGKHAQCAAKILVNKKKNMLTNQYQYYYPRIIEGHSSSCGIHPFAPLHCKYINLIMNSILYGDTLHKAYARIIIEGPNNLTSICPEAAATFPTEQKLRKPAYRLYSKMFPKTPSSLPIDIPEKWYHILGDINNEKFILTHEILDNNTEFIIMGSERVSNALFRAKVWYVDGTFKVCPDLFQQLFSIHFIANDRLIAGLYCILTHKTQDIYIRVLNKVKEIATSRNITLQVTNVMADFEDGLRNALRQTLLVTVDGCFFHFCQAIIRKVNSLNLKVIMSYQIRYKYVNAYLITVYFIAYGIGSV